jgi:hypothetical protein
MNAGSDIRLVQSVHLPLSTNTLELRNMSNNCAALKDAWKEGRLEDKYPVM